MILVMGASGNIGHEIVKNLQAEGAAFQGGYRSPEEVEKAHQEGVETVIVDYGQPDTLDAALKGVEKAFFVTSPSPQMAELEGHIIRAAKRAGVQHLVKSSVYGADGDDFSFARAHRAVEKQIEASGLAYTFLRPNGFMQNLLGQAGSIKEQGAFYIAVGAARVSEIDVRDIGRVAATILTTSGHAGKAYELTGPEALTYTERATILSEVLGRPIHYVSPPDADWVQGLTASGVSEWQAEGMLDLMHYYQKGKAERVSPAVEQITGKPATPFRQFVEDFASALR